MLSRTAQAIALTTLAGVAPSAALTAVLPSGISAASSPAASAWVVEEGRAWSAARRPATDAGTERMAPAANPRARPVVLAPGVAATPGEEAAGTGRPPWPLRRRQAAPDNLTTDAGADLPRREAQRGRAAVLLAQAQRLPGDHRRLPPPSASLLRSLDALQRDLERLEGSLMPASEPPAAAPQNEAQLLAELTAPAAEALPQSAAALTIRRRVRLSLPTALAVALRNDPELAAEVRTVRERRDLANAARGRWWPELGLELGGALSGQRSYNAVWQADGWNLIQTNAGFGAAGLTLNWALISPERGAAIAEADQELKAAGQRYGNRLRQLQLSTSEAYYGLQLADQLQRIRAAVVERDTVVRDQVAALKQAGLVPRLDLLRAEANLQQSRYRLAQAEALQQSRQRQLSNRLNVPFDITLTASAAAVLQPPWPLDLEQTLLRGLQANPQLQALQTAREALLRQADRRAAQLLPTLRLVAAAGYGETITSKPLIQLEGCCAATNIRQLYNQSADWAAGLQLHWRVFDGGVTAAEVAASRSAAGRTAETLARERNAIRQRLEAAFFDHRASLEQIVAARASYAAAREAFRDVRARYQLGLSDYTAVADTISTLTTAMEGVAEATTLANVSYAQLLRELLPVPDQPGAPVELPLVLEVGGSPTPPAAGASGVGLPRLRSGPDHAPDAKRPSP
jgi:outer membrane protein TolC